MTGRVVEEVRLLYLILPPPPLNQYTSIDLRNT